MTQCCVGSIRYVVAVVVIVSRRCIIIFRSVPLDLLLNTSLPLITLVDFDREVRFPIPVISGN